MAVLNAEPTKVTAPPRAALRSSELTVSVAVLLSGP
jgi:hypothetical protein